MYSRLFLRRLITSGPRVPEIILRDYKSSISLDKLYPQSTLNIAKSPTIPQNGPDRFSGYIPMEKLKVTYSRSSGPGGQHVNTCNSKVDCRFLISDANWIPEVIRENILIKYRNSISKDGFLIIQSDRTRSAHMNLADAVEKIREMIRTCEPVELAEPTPETLERMRRKREKVARERLLEKRIRSRTKGSRGGTSVGDF